MWVNHGDDSGYYMAYREIGIPTKSPHRPNHLPAAHKFLEQ